MKITENQIYIGLGLLAVLILFNVVKQISSIFKKSEKDKQIESDVTEFIKIDPIHTVNIQNLDHNTYTYLQNLAIKLGVAMYGFGTDESAIFNVIKSLKTQTDFQYIIGIYSLMYNANLQIDLKSELSDEEIANINNIIAGLPLA